MNNPDLISVVAMCGLQACQFDMLSEDPGNHMPCILGLCVCVCVALFLSMCVNICLERSPVFDFWSCQMHLKQFPLADRVIIWIIIHHSSNPGRMDIHLKDDTI